MTRETTDLAGTMMSKGYREIGIWLRRDHPGVGIRKRDHRGVGIRNRRAEESQIDPKETSWTEP
jgi:hypothetical protein